MKKHLLATSIILSSLCASAAVEAEWQWTRSFNAGDGVMSNVDYIVPTTNGEYYVVADFSKSTTLQWGDDDVAPAEGMTFAYQKNFMIGRMNADGSLKWQVVPTLANTANNSIHIAATADGGVVLACNATCNGAKGAGWPALMSLAGTDGATVTVDIPETPEGVSAYEGVVIKFSAEGVIEWNQLVYANPYADDEKTISDTNPVSVNGVAADSEGNVYIGGYYKTTLDLGNGVTAPKAVNGSVVNGKIADTGCAFIAKYNAEGKAEKVLVNASETAYAAKETLNAIAISGDKLYFAGLVSPLADAEYSVFGKPVSISDKLANNLFYGAVDCATLECTGADALISTVNETVTSHTAQLAEIEVYGSNLYLTGALKGGYEQDGQSIGFAETLYTLPNGNTAYNLAAMTVGVSTETLKAKKMYLGSKSIGYNYCSIESEENNRLYTYGYVMLGGAGATYGYLGEFDLTTGEQISENQLYSGISSVKGAYFNNETKQFLATCYSSALSGIAGSDYDASFKSFHGFLTSFKLPVSATTGVTAVEAESNSDAAVEYFNIQGMRIANPAAGQLVIRRQGNKVEKLVIR